MKFSIITITYNSAKTIQHTIESFLEQDWHEKEMILIDGSSKDDTLDIINSARNDKEKECLFKNCLRLGSHLPYDRHVSA